MKPLTSLTPSEKEKILARLFWDRETPETDIVRLIEKNIINIDNIQSRQFFGRLLSSCDWYTLLKLIPSNKLQIVLSDPVLDTLFPHDLKHKYRYAREQLSKHHIPASGQNPFGPIQPSPIFHRVDSWRNILSNKLCALSRLEVKDIVDIVFIAKKYAFDWETILYEAKEKDLWVEPIDVCRTIRQFPTDLLSTIKWIGNIDLEELKQHIDVVHDEIFTGVANSLFTSDSSLA